MPYSGGCSALTVDGMKQQSSSATGDGNDIGTGTNIRLTRMGGLAGLPVMWEVDIDHEPDAQAWRELLRQATNVKSQARGDDDERIN